MPKIKRFNPNEFIRCQRGNQGHAWYDYDDPEIVSRKGDPTLDKCERCGTIRVSVFHPRTGELVGNRRYIWPKGYRYAADERPSMNELHLALLTLRRQTARHEQARVKRNVARVRQVREAEAS